MKLWKIIILQLLLSLLYCPISAQQAWNLEMCISEALNKNTTIKRQQVQVDKQAIQVEIQKNRRLPNLTGGITQKLDFGRSLNRENVYADVNSQSSSFYLSTEIPLFTGFDIPNSIARHKLEFKVHSATLEKIENDIALQVVRLYYQILLNREISKIAKEQINLSKELEKNTIVLSKHGKLPESQILEIQAQVANDELQAVIAQNTLQLSLIDLAQLMELDEAYSFDIEPIQEDSIIPLLENPEDIFYTAKRIMPEVRAAIYSIKSNEKAVEIAKSGYYPKLSLEIDFNTGYYHLSDAVNPSFGSQLNNNSQRTIYLNLQVPLFNGFSTRNNVRLARRDLEDSKLVAENTERTLYKEIQKAYYDAVAAWEKYNATRKAATSNKEAFRYAQEKYNAGKNTTYEFNEVKMKLANSLSDQAQAKYEFMLQKFLLDFYRGNPVSKRIK